MLETVLASAKKASAPDAGGAYIYSGAVGSSPLARVQQYRYGSNVTLDGITLTAGYGRWAGTVVGNATQMVYCHGTASNGQPYTDTAFKYLFSSDVVSTIAAMSFTMSNSCGFSNASRGIVTGGTNDSGWQFTTNYRVFANDTNVYGSNSPAARYGSCGWGLSEKGFTVWGQGGQTSYSRQVYMFAHANNVWSTTMTTFGGVQTNVSAAGFNITYAGWTYGGSGAASTVTRYNFATDAQLSGGTTVAARGNATGTGNTTDGYIQYSGGSALVDKYNYASSTSTAGSSLKTSITYGVIGTSVPGGF